jgi:putative endonuclease
MDRYYFVYIVTNKKNGTLYTGITNNLIKRVWQHKEKQIEGFTERYNLDMLVYYEIYKDPETAIKREKRLKFYQRQWKINIIEESNPEWRDLYSDIVYRSCEQVAG